MPKNLINLLSEKNLNLDEITEYLSKKNLPHEDSSLPSNDPSLFAAEWSAKNSIGESIFEIAKKRNNLMLFQRLLDFDMPIDEQYKKEGLSEEICALLDSRGAWQRKLQLEYPTMPFNRAHEFARWMQNKIVASPTKGLLLMGASDHGKTTLVNFQSGVDYEINDTTGDLQKRSDCNVVEPGIRGQTSHSQTIFPTIYPTIGDWIDMAGIRDTHGSLYELCTAVGTQILAKKIEEIQGFLFVSHECSTIPWMDKKFEAYKLVANCIGRIINTGNSKIDDDLKKRVIFVATKPSEKLTKEIVQTRLKIFYNEQLKDLDKSAAMDDLTYQNKLAQQRVTEIFLNDINKIVIVDVTVPEARKEIRKAIDHLPPARSSQDFNFSDYHPIIQIYKNQFRIVQEYYKELKNKKNEQEKEILRCTKERELLTGAGTIMERIEKNSLRCSKIENEIKCLEHILDNSNIRYDELEKSCEKSKRRLAIFDSMNDRKAIQFEQTQLASFQELKTQTENITLIAKKTLERKQIEFKDSLKGQDDLIKEKAAFGDLDFKDKEKCEARLNEAIYRQELAEKHLHQLELQVEVNIGFFKKLDKLNKDFDFNFDFMIQSNSTKTISTPITANSPTFFPNFSNKEKLPKNKIKAVQEVMPMSKQKISGKGETTVKNTHAAAQLF